jgi:K+-sensing histidine kinase KdpD
VAHKIGPVQLKTNHAGLGNEQLEKISHDFRAPLNIIIGFSELLLDETPGKINGEQRRALNDILNSGHHLLTLVNDTFSTPSPDLKKVKTGQRLPKTAEIFYQR